MEEMLDTFDINGNFLGIKTRSFCHSENPQVYHKPVWIWIINNRGGILLQKRSLHKKKGAGLWDMPSAGHVDAGESCIDACVRETKEELGLDVKTNNFKFKKQFVNQKGWELAQIYVLKLDANANDFTLQKEEVEKVKWFNYNDFVELFYSDKFCGHAKEYKDYVCKMLKEEIKN